MEYLLHISLHLLKVRTIFRSFDLAAKNKVIIQKPKISATDTKAPLERVKAYDDDSEYSYSMTHITILYNRNAALL